MLCFDLFWSFWGHPLIWRVSACKLSLGKKKRFFSPKIAKKQKLRNWVTEWAVDFSGKKIRYLWLGPMEKFTGEGPFGTVQKYEQWRILLHINTKPLWTNSAKTIYYAYFVPGNPIPHGFHKDLPVLLSIFYQRWKILLYNISLF